MTPEQARQRRTAEIAAWVRGMRLATTLSQARLAREVGVTQASISNYEAGKRDIPSSVLYAVADVFGVGVPANL